MTSSRVAAITAGAMAIVAACAAGGASVASRAGKPARTAWQERIIRVALATSAPRAQVSARGDYRLFAEGGSALIANPQAGVTYTIERDGSRLRAVRENGVATAWRGGPLVVSTVDEDAPVVYDGRSYRGELWIVPVDSGLRVINRLFVEDYLRSVVPAEIGARPAEEHAAAEAQAVAARSYVFTRLGSLRDMRGYDVVAGVADQVYRGVATERPVTDLAVSATMGLVLYYNGRAVSAPYSSTCGGSTAAAGEVFRANEEPHLRRVSDRIPGSDRFFCENAPRFKWTRSLEGDVLERAMATYLRRYARSGSGPVGVVRDVRVESFTPSGRAVAILVDTDAGRFRVQGNDTRYVLRPPDGEMLNSTYFTLAARTQNGRVRSLTVNGGGYGHGVGMCQWGAIGRARAGHDFRSILLAYYPGTTIAPAR